MILFVLHQLLVLDAIIVEAAIRLAADIADCPALLLLSIINIISARLPFKLAA